MNKIILVTLLSSVSLMAMESPLRERVNLPLFVVGEITSLSDHDNTPQHSSYLDPVAVVDWKHEYGNPLHNILVMDDAGEWHFYDKLPKKPGLEDFSVSANANLLAMIADDSRMALEIYDLSNPIEPITIKLDSQIKKFAFHPNNEQIAVLCFDHSIKLFDITEVEAKEVDSIQLTSSAYYPSILQFDRSGKRLLVAEDRCLTLFTVDNTSVDKTLVFEASLAEDTGPTMRILSAAAFSRDSTLLVLAESRFRGTRHIIRVFDLTLHGVEMQHLDRATKEYEDINTIDISPDNALIVFSTLKNTGKVIDLAGNVVCNIEDTLYEPKESSFHESSWWIPKVNVCSAVKFLSNHELLVLGETNFFMQMTEGYSLTVIPSINVWSFFHGKTKINTLKSQLSWKLITEYLTSLKDTKPSYDGFIAFIGSNYGDSINGATILKTLAFPEAYLRRLLPGWPQ